MKEHKLIREIQLLKEKGLIPPENVENIQKYYENEKKINPKYAIGATSIAGILLVLAGGVLRASSFWADFPVWLKLVFAAAPLVAAGWAGFFTFTSNKGRAWREFSAVLTAFGSTFLAVMIPKIYDLAWVDTQQTVRLTMLVSLLLIYIFGSSILTILYSIGLFFNVGDQMIDYIAVMLVMPYILTHLRHDSPGRIAIRYAALIIGIFGFFDFGLFYAPLALGTLAVVLLFGGWELYQRNRESLFLNPWLTAGFVGFVAFLAAASSFNKIYDINPGNGQYKLFYWLSTGGLLAVLAAVFPRRRWDAKRIIPIIIILGMIFPLNQAVNPLWMRIFVIATGALFFLALISNGIRKSESALFNGGLFGLAILAYCRFYDTGISVLVRSIGLVALGSLFILANIIFFLVNIRREKRQKLEAESAAAAANDGETPEEEQQVENEKEEEK